MRVVLFSVVALVLGCGARSGLDTDRDAGAEVGPDADTEPDRDCPHEAREGRGCDLDPVPSCTGCPERTRVCFIQSDDGLRGCSCRQGHWVCEPAGCAGWGLECTNAVNEDVCGGGLGCGACCAFDGGAPVATWCDCIDGGRPFCSTDVVCSGP